MVSASDPKIKVWLKSHLDITCNKQYSSINKIIQKQEVWKLENLKKFKDLQFYVCVVCDATKMAFFTEEFQVLSLMVL